MFKRSMLLLGAVFILIIAAACSNTPVKQEQNQEQVKEETPAANQSETRVVKDMFGEVTIPVKPKNLLVSSSNYAEYLIEMGVAPQYALVVPEIEPDYRKPYMEKNGVELITTQQYDFNFEKLLSLSPDLIIVPGQGMEKNVYDELSKIAPTVALDANSGMHVAMSKLAELFDKKAESDKVLAEFDKKAAEAKEKIHQAIGDKTVLVLRVEPRRYRYLGPKSEDDVSKFFYETLGLKSPDLIKDSTEWFTPLSLELLPEINPDYVFLEKRSMENYDSSDSLKELEDSSLWKHLAAVKNNGVFPLRTNDFIQAKGPIGTSMLIDYIVEKLVP
ncbi:ABC transporter substrate-binding protein [Paenibacillus gorillae]|uniref:ABC transporter substrate-binding protein n=1 Tax=Paenibacillus gorillae TaxID=1243662 RepID=UPI0004AFFDFD|nr:ABC transporter substrate-binding protein [Paenibacillus gorillae]